MNNSITQIKINDRESKRIVESIDKNQNCSVDKEEMIIFFEILLNIEKTEP